RRGGAVARPRAAAAVRRGAGVGAAATRPRRGPSGSRPRRGVGHGVDVRSLRRLRTDQRRLHDLGRADVALACSLGKRGSMEWAGHWLLGALILLPFVGPQSPATRAPAPLSVTPAWLTLDLEPDARPVRPGDRTDIMQGEPTDEGGWVLAEGSVSWAR